jgi:hypothetical protein
MARKIIIVTEHGHNYNQDGQLFITNAMKDKYGVAAKTYFFSGPDFCKKGVISKTIVEPNDDMFVIWAKNATDTEPGNMRIFPPEVLTKLSKDLMDPKFEDKTAWEILKILSEEE